jgi:hypothetical protein
MVELFPNVQIIQELVCYARSRFRLIILGMKNPQKGLEKRQKWMVKCLRQEVVRNDSIYHLEYF